MRKIKKAIGVVLAASLIVGTLVTGNVSVQAAERWSQENGQWYLYNDSNAKMTGWYQDSNGRWFYLKPNENGAMAIGWLNIDGLYYYFDQNGYMCTGWIYVNNRYYLMNSDNRDNLPLGAMLTGWQDVVSDNGTTHTYYMQPSGEMCTGWQYIKGQWYYFNKDGYWLGADYDTAAQGKIFGIDVSKYQGTIDWTQVRNAGVDFALVRVGHGDRVLDPTFKQNMEGANNVGVAAGGYFYSKAQSTAQAILDAQFVIDNLNGCNVSYPVAIDLEDSSQANLTKQQITDIAIAFCNEIRAAGYTPMVYCNESWYRDRIDFSRLSNVGCWVARYNYKPSEEISRDIWQAGSTTILPGIDGYVDIDFANTNYRAIVAPRTAADPSYVKTTGAWVQNGVGWWYSYFAGGYPANQWELINGKWYHFDANGYMQTGWYWNGSSWYYLNADGDMATGWVCVNGKWYYMEPSEGRMITGWYWNGYNWYYLNKDGDMATGWVWNGYNWFYTTAEGSMTTGWIYVNNNWYYMNADGEMQTGWVFDGYAWYYMYNSGAMAYNTWIGSYYVNNSGAWAATR